VISAERGRHSHRCPHAGGLREASLKHNDKRVTGIYARWHMFEENREAVMAIEAAVLSFIQQERFLVDRVGQIKRA